MAQKNTSYDWYTEQNFQASFSKHFKLELRQEIPGSLLLSSREAQIREFAIILALISAALFAWVLGSEADEIGLRDFSVFAVALAVLLTVQLLLLYLLDKLVGVVAPRNKEWILLFVAAVLLASNAYFLAFYALELPTGTRIASSAAVGATFLILMVFPRARPILAVFAGVMLVMSLIQYAYTRATFGGDDVTADTVSLPVHSKRNVYIIGFESLQSPAAYRENYGIEDAPHFKVLRDAGFRVLENAYSAERATLMTYATIFEFARAFDESDLGAKGVFINDNSTFRSFRDSGYSIQFMYKDGYTFAVNSNNVDYVYQPLGFHACDELGKFYFYGICSKNVVKSINENIFRSAEITYRQQIPLLKQRVDFLIQPSRRPWFTWTHIKHPFHTKGYMRHPDPEYAAEFKRRVNEALPTIAENMRNTAGYIVPKDPDSVVIVMGDHGTHLFRGDEETVKKQVFSGAPLWPLKAVLEDEQGVTFAVYPASFCENRMSERFSTRFLIENLIACLNGDDSPTDEERRRARLIRFLGDLWEVDELLAKTLTH